MKKWKVFGVVLAVMVVGGLIVEPQEKSVEVKTLSDYANSYEKSEIIQKALKVKNWNIALMDDYEKCMNDFSRTKDPNLEFSMVLGWCNMRLEPSKEKPQLEVKRFDNVADVMREWGGNYDIDSVKPNEIILYTKYFPNDFDKYILEEAKRYFIDAVYQTFLHTDFDEVTITVIPTNVQNPKESKYAFKGTISKNDALRVLKEAVGVTDLRELYVESGSASRKFNQIRYNDQGGLTLDRFFNMLVEYVK